LALFGGALPRGADILFSSTLTPFPSHANVDADIADAVRRKLPGNLMFLANLVDKNF
jgi:hypothetical protein